MNMTDQAALTVLPIIPLLILMRVLRWSAIRADVISLLVTISVAAMLLCTGNGFLFKRRTIKPKISKKEAQ